MGNETMIDLESAMEAVLFAAGEPMEQDRLAEILEIDKLFMQGIIESLKVRLDNEGGLSLIILDSKIQLVTKPAMASYVRKALEVRRNIPLSQAALEVLAVIAYRQPVTKAYIEQTRGVDCSGPMTTLSTRGLIEENGRLDLPGRPLVYGTTDVFLRCFGVSSLEQLPDLAEVEISAAEANTLEGSQISLFSQQT